jgi:signal transduction histidine kinase
MSSRVKNYGYELLSRKNIECLYRIDPYVDKRLTNPDARKNVLLMIKEALNNIAKYSDASVAEVFITIHDGQMVVQVRDNGRGFDIRSVKPGHGLIHMKQRAEALGGVLEINSTDRCTTIEARIPLASISD